MIGLVVIIIVLIILVGVSINMLIGDNGIIMMAQKAKENMELAAIEEEKQLNQLYEQLTQSGVTNTTDNYFYLTITADDTVLDTESARSIDYLNTNYAGKTYDITDATTLEIQFSQIENSIRYDADMTYTLK